MTQAQKMQAQSTVLFIGDSVTDVGRDRSVTAPNHRAGLGQGYVQMAAMELMHRVPGVRVFNRGVSGDRVPHLAKRWQQDVLDLKPDVLSILIGVNDEWRFHDDYERGVGTTLGDYESGLRELVRRTPGVKLVLMEPFVLRCGAVTDAWFPSYDQRREIVRRLASECHATFVPVQGAFDGVTRDSDPSWWIPDGVHPSGIGHAMIAHQWLRTVLG